MIITNPKTRRRGATLVELTFVVLIFCMLMFGIMEYCLIIYTSNLVENAAREGTRYAVVNASDATVVSDTQAYAKSLMGGLDMTMTGYTCNVYLADSNGNDIGSAAGAQFGQYICCDISINYVPVTPGLIFLKQFTIRSKCSMMSEAN
jgi:Flp pilus assembly protein TadG